MPSDDEFQPVPAVALIYLARKAARPAEITVRQAAPLGGISVVRWNQLELGRETRSGELKAAIPTSGTVAKMAYGVNRAAGRILITPERLAGEGQDPEAARILAEMIEQDEAHPRPAPVPPAAQPLSRALPPGVAATADLWHPYLLDVIREEIEGVQPEGAEVTIWAQPHLDQVDKRAMIAYSRWHHDGRPGEGKTAKARLTPGPLAAWLN